MDRYEMLEEILDSIPDLNGKLDFLTSLEILTSSDYWVSICRDFRNDLCFTVEDFI